MHRLRPVVLGAFLLGLSAGSTPAEVVVYYGRDPGAGPGQSAPNSTAAEASFLGEVGPARLIDFELAPLGSFHTLALEPDVSVALSASDLTPPPGFRYGIADDHPDARLGYNVTPGGSRFLRFAPELGAGTAGLTFEFATPIDAVGLSITGLGVSSGPLYAIFGPGPEGQRVISGHAAGGRIFFGLTGLAWGITQLRLELRGVGTTSRDVFGVDDLRFREWSTPSAIPEPSTWVAGILGLLAAGARGLRRRSPRR
jgi:hypothetical protein